MHMNASGSSGNHRKAPGHVAESWAGKVHNGEEGVTREAIFNVNDQFIEENSAVYDNATGVSLFTDLSSEELEAHNDFNAEAVFALDSADDSSAGATGE